jgi:hypothetical protein
LALLLLSLLRSCRKQRLQRLRAQQHKCRITLTLHSCKSCLQQQQNLSKQLQRQLMQGFPASSSTSSSSRTLPAVAAVLAAAAAGCTVHRVLGASWLARWCRLWQHTSAAPQAAAACRRLL